VSKLNACHCTSPPSSAQIFATSRDAESNVAVTCQDDAAVSACWFTHEKKRSSQLKNLFNSSFSSLLSRLLLECNKAALARLRADQMEAAKSVAENYDKME
jgi:hypothetical protein